MPKKHTRCPEALLLTNKKSGTVMNFYQEKAETVVKPLYQRGTEQILVYFEN